MARADASTIVENQRRFFATGATRDVEFRKRQLRELKRAVMEARSDILAALKEDMNKPPFEAYVAEVSQVAYEIDYALKRLSHWAGPRRVPTPSFLQPAKSFVYPEPLGVTLIIGPWNYPLDLVLTPLVGAMAAGNCAVLKPSEISAATSRVIARIIGEHFDPGYVAVVEGGPEQSTALLAERFDYILYTGNGSVGRIVMEAAARHLTPVTLELGGKSPCIVEPDVPLDRAARRIAWGKFFNAGQTCIAPDYLLVQRSVKRELLEGIARYIERFYGADPRQSPDYCRIVSDRHFERLVKLLDSGTTVVGGEREASERYIAPTVLDGVTLDDPVMQEEVFGPILPVLEYDELDEAIRLVRERPRPLALYFFSRDRAKQRKVMAETISGGGCINDTMVYYSNSRLPFGGVGDSGFGRYHGRASFDTFTNQKSMVARPFAFDIYLRYPPYRNMARLAERVIRFIT